MKKDLEKSKHENVKKISEKLMGLEHKIKKKIKTHI